MSSHELICKILSKSLTSEDYTLLANDDLWDQVMPIIAYHRISGAILYSLQDCGLDKHIPNRIKHQIAEDISAATTKGSMLWTSALNVFSRLNHANVPFLALKGIALTHHLYEGNIAKRRYSDIDILINEKDISRVTTVLNDAGYYQFNTKALYQEGKRIMCTKQELLQKQLLTHELAPFFSNDSSRISIDVNIRFSWKGPRSYREPMLPFEELWERRYPLTPVEGWTLCPNDMLLHLVIHLYNEAIFFLYSDNPIKSRETSYFRFYDIYALLNGNGHYKVNAAHVIENARRANALQQLYYSLYYVTMLFGEGIWSELLHDIEKEGDYSDFIDSFYMLTGEYKKWPIQMIDRLNNIQKKQNFIRNLIANGSK